MWFWLITAIAGSIIGSATESWFRDTKMGVWFYSKVDAIYTWANMRSVSYTHLTLPTT